MSANGRPHGRSPWAAGQATIEMSVLVAVMALALLAMAVYYKRGMAGYVHRTREVLNTNAYLPGRVTGQQTVSLNGRRHAETFLVSVAGVKTDAWILSVQGQQVSVARNADDTIEIVPGPFGAPDTVYGSTPMTTSMTTQETLTDDPHASIFAR